MIRWLAIGGALAALAGSSASAQPTQTKLLPDEPDLRGGFGRMLDFSHDVVAVGAPEAGPQNFGAVVLFRRHATGWHQEATLTASDGAMSRRFGGPVVLTQDVVAAGEAAPNFPGSTYVFRRGADGWQEEAKLRASDLGVLEKINPTDAEGDTLVASSCTHDHEGTDAAGAVYVFRYDGESWVEEAELLAPDPQEDQFFGCDAALSGDWLIVRALGAFRGPVYAFRRDESGWVEATPPVQSDAQVGDRFGSDLDLSGDVAVIGAHTHDTDAGEDAGAAYVYRRDGETWIEEAKLIASDGVAGDRFGEAVGISGNAIAIGAPANDDRAPSAGAVYVFRFDGVEWIEEHKLTALDAFESEVFGVAIAVDGDDAVAGTFRDDGSAPGVGAVYVLEGLTALRVDVDVRPGSGINRIRPGSRPAAAGTSTATASSI